MNRRTSAELDVIRASIRSEFLAHHLSTYRVAEVVGCAESLVRNTLAALPEYTVEPATDARYREVYDVYLRNVREKLAIRYGINCSNTNLTIVRRYCEAHPVPVGTTVTQAQASNKSITPSARSESVV